MEKQNNWKVFFNNHAPVYMDQWYTQGATEDVAYFLDVLKLPLGSTILDIGCGTGRHDVELARRGYQVTGIDFSAGMLAEAEKAAKTAGVLVEWILADATEFKSDQQFDAAICMLEAAFGLLPLEGAPIEHDLAILRNVHAALKPGARFMLHATNGFKAIRETNQEEINSGKFDPLTLTRRGSATWDTSEGEKQVPVRSKAYLPTELVTLLNSAGFEVENMWAGDKLHLGRRPIQLDDYMIMVVAKKLFDQAD